MKVGAGVAVGGASVGRSVGATVAVGTAALWESMLAVAVRSASLSVLKERWSADGDTMTSTGGGAVGEGRLTSGAGGWVSGTAVPDWQATKSRRARLIRNKLAFAAVDCPETNRRNALVGNAAN